MIKMIRKRRQTLAVWLMLVIMLMAPMDYLRVSAAVGQGGYSSGESGGSKTSGDRNKGSGSEASKDDDDKDSGLEDPDDGDKGGGSKEPDDGEKGGGSKDPNEGNKGTSSEAAGKDDIDDDLLDEELEEELILDTVLLDEVLEESNVASPSIAGYWLDRDEPENPALYASNSEIPLGGTAVYRVVVRRGGLSVASEGYTLKISYEGADNRFPLQGIEFDDTKGGFDEHNDQTVTYELPGNFSMESVDLTFRTNGQMAFNEETMNIVATLTDVASNEVVNSTENSTATVKIENMKLSYGMRMVTPSRLPEGADVSLVGLHFSPSGTAWTANRTLGMYLRAVEIEVDFSDVEITLGGGAPTRYIDLLTQGNSPVTIRNQDGSELGKNNAGFPVIWKVTAPVNDALYTSSNTNYLFQIKTETDFAEKDTIDFGKIDPEKFKIKVRVNGNGPAVSMKPYRSDNLIPPTEFLGVAPSDTILKAVKDELKIIVFRGVADANAAYIQPNSKRYETYYINNKAPGFLYYQELFKVGLDRARSASAAELEADDDTIKITIPDGVTVTHIRTPRTILSNNNQLATYKGITYTTEHGTTRVDPGDVIKGEEIKFETNDDGSRFFVLTVHDLVKIEASLNEKYIYTNTNLIQFAGTTDDSVGEGTELTFIVEDYEKPENKEPVTARASEKYYAQAHMHPIAAIRTWEDANRRRLVQTNTAARGDIVYLSSAVSASWYPYYSALHVNPEQPNGNTIYGNPVLYFNLPKDLEFINTENEDGKVILTNISPMTDAYDTPLAATARLLDGKGYHEGGQLVEVKIHAASSVNGPVYLKGNDKILHVNLPVRVVDDGPGDKTVNFRNIDVVAGTWEDERYIEDMGIAGAAGTLVEQSGLRFAGDQLSETEHLITNQSTSAKIFELNVTSPPRITAFGAVRVVDEGTVKYLSYDNNNPETIPELRAGSENEEFKVRLFNGLPRDFNSAKLYFLLPVGEGHKWQPELSGEPIYDKKNDAYGYGYEVFYTTKILDVGSESLEPGTGELNNNNGIWKSVTELPPEWSDVTGLKFEFTNFKSGADFQALLPYKIPTVNGSTVTYGAVAIGQTLYYLEDENSSSSPTAALKLRKSDPPVILDVHPDGEQYFQTGQTGLFTVQYKDDNSKIFDWGWEWDRVITYDDYTEPLDLQSITVTFTPKGGISETVKIFEEKDLEAKDYKIQVIEPGKNSRITSIKYGVNEGPENYVNTNREGEYTITYKTKEDNDEWSSAVKRRIIVNREYYKVTYNPNGGIMKQPAPPEESVKLEYSVGTKGKHQIIPNEPILDGYYFIGWKHNGDNSKLYGSKTGNNEFDVHDSDVILTAQWEEIPTYTVTYDVNGGDPTGRPEPPQVRENTPHTVVNYVPTHTTYNFLGWENSVDGKVYKSGESFLVTTDVTLTAQWGYMIQFRPGDIKYPLEVRNLPPTAELKASDSSLVLDQQPTHPHYDFNEWEHNTGSRHKPGSTLQVTGSGILTAIWTPKSYNVTYIANGSNVTGMPENETVEALERYTVSNLTPTRSGYRFDGWLGSDGVTYTSSVSILMVRNITLTAQWTRLGGGGNGGGGNGGGGGGNNPRPITPNDPAPIIVEPGEIPLSPLTPWPGLVTSPGTGRIPNALDELARTGELFAEGNEPVVRDNEQAVEENETPLAPDPVANEASSPGSGQQSTWALVNLILALYGLLITVCVVVSRILRRKKQNQNPEQGDNGEEIEQTEEQPKRKEIFLWLSVAAAILLPVIFLIFEDISGLMIIVNSRTLLMAVITMVQVLLLILARRKDTQDNDTDEDTPITEAS